MMKNKYAQYFLVPLLVVVWGTVFYKIYIAISGESYELPNTPSFFASTKDVVDTETYTLLLDYKDPFLGKKVGVASTKQRNSSTPTYRNQPSASANIPSTNNKKNANKASKDETPIIVETPLPEIVYLGWLLQETDTVALLKINTQYIPNARKGDIRQKVRIDEIFRDSIQLSAGGRHWTVLK